MRIRLTFPRQIISEVQSDPAYEEAISTLLDLVKKYAVVAKESIVEAAQNSSAEIKTNEKVETAASLFRDIIESFVGDLTPLFGALDKLIVDLRSDDKVSELLHKVDRFVGRSLHDPAFITSTRASRRLDNLMDEARELINSNDVWKKDVENMTTELNRIFDHAKNDRALVNLGNKVDKFGEAAKRFALSGVRLGQKKVDNMGNLGDIFSDITQVILPRLIQVVRSIPLPRIEVCGFSPFVAPFFSFLSLRSTRLPTLTSLSTTSSSRANHSFPTSLDSRTISISAASEATLRSRALSPTPPLSTSLVRSSSLRTTTVTDVSQQVCD